MSHTTIYDAIIVGSGPAGGTAAYYLGEAGQRVLVLEKETLPRYKTCGGAIPASILEQFPFSFAPVIESRVRSTAYALGKRAVSFKLPDWPICMVMRSRFDAYLLEHARAELRHGTAVRNVMEKDDRVVVETRRGETYEGRSLIAADGANSVVAHSLGLRQGKTLMAAVEAEAPVPVDILRRHADTPLFIFGEIRKGYLWIFPKASHLSVGICALRPHPGELQATLKRVMGRYGISLEGIPLHGHPIPIFTRHEPIASPRILLAGDAAGLVDPLNGEGIRFAIKSGRLAAQAVLSGQIRQYAQKISQEIQSNHRYASGLARLFYTFPRICFTLGVCNPFATQAFVKLMNDQISYPEALVQLFGSLPIYLAVEGTAALASLLGSPDHGRSVRALVYRLE